MEREAGSSGLQGDKAIAKRGQKSQKGVVGDKAEEPWTHPSESAQPGGRDPVLTTVTGHRLPSEHVVDTTRTGQNSGLMGAIFAPLGDTWQYLET